MSANVLAQYALIIPQQHLKAHQFTLELQDNGEGIETRRILTQQDDYQGCYESEPRI